MIPVDGTDADDDGRPRRADALPQPRAGAGGGRGRLRRAGPEGARRGDRRAGRRGRRHRVPALPDEAGAVDAVLRRRSTSRCSSDAERGARRPDPADAFERFFVALPSSRPATARSPSRWPTRLETVGRAARARRAADARSPSSSTRAQAAGAVRADIGPADVSMLFSGVAHATAVARRPAAGAARALRAHHPRRPAPRRARRRCPGGRSTSCSSAG